eukprot:scaffold16141_cov101-Isochrysis_galbana.AAC.1
MQRHCTHGSPIASTEKKSSRLDCAAAVTTVPYRWQRREGCLPFAAGSVSSEADGVPAGHTGPGSPVMARRREMSSSQTRIQLQTLLTKKKLVVP